VICYSFGHGVGRDNYILRSEDSGTTWTLDGPRWSCPSTDYYNEVTCYPFILTLYGFAWVYLDGSLLLLPGAAYGWYPSFDADSGNVSSIRVFMLSRLIRPLHLGWTGSDQLFLVWSDLDVHDSWVQQPPVEQR
jgi:hypothetical protein